MNKAYTYLLLLTIIASCTNELSGMKKLFCSLSGSKRLTDETIFSDMPPSPRDSEDSLRCTHCSGEFYIGEIISRTTCAHEFHQSCLNEILEQDGCCPKCTTIQNPDVIKHTTIESPQKRSVTHNNIRIKYSKRGDPLIRIYCTRHSTERLYQIIEAENKTIDSIVFTTHSCFIYVIYIDKQIDLCNIKRGTREIIIKPPRTCVANWFCTENLVYVEYIDKKIDLFTLKTGIVKMQAQHKTIKTIGLMKDMFAILYQNRKIDLFSTETGEKITTIETQKKKIITMECFQKNIFYIEYEDKQIELHNLVTGNKMQRNLLNKKVLARNLLGRNTLHIAYIDQEIDTFNIEECL